MENKPFLYMVTIGFMYDDDTYVKLILSFEPLTKESIEHRSDLITIDEGYFIAGLYSVSDSIILNCWTEKESDEMKKIIGLLA